MALLATLNVLGDYLVVDEDAEYVEDRVEIISGGYGIGLMDLNGDGVPEVWEAYFGGSMGNTYFILYDLYSGAELGNYNSGWYGNYAHGMIAAYLSAEDGSIRTLSKGTHRYGWSARERFVHGFLYDGEAGRYCVDSLFTESMMYITESELYEGGGEGWSDAVYLDSQYTRNGEKTSMESYYSDYECFFLQYQLLETTAMLLLDWEVEEGATKYERAVKMADLLLASDQQFVLPNETAQESN